MERPSAWHCSVGERYFHSRELKQTDCYIPRIILRQFIRLRLTLQWNGTYRTKNSAWAKKSAYISSKLRFSRMNVGRVTLVRSMPTFTCCDKCFNTVWCWVTSTKTKASNHILEFLCKDTNQQKWPMSTYFLPRHQIVQSRYHSHCCHSDNFFHSKWDQSKETSPQNRNFLMSRRLLWWKCCHQLYLLRQEILSESQHQQLVEATNILC